MIVVNNPDHVSSLSPLNVNGNLFSWFFLGKMKPANPNSYKLQSNLQIYRLKSSQSHNIIEILWDTTAIKYWFWKVKGQALDFTLFFGTPVVFSISWAVKYTCALKIIDGKNLLPPKTGDPKNHLILPLRIDLMTLRMNLMTGLTLQRQELWKPACQVRKLCYYASLVN